MDSMLGSDRQRRDNGASRSVSLREQFVSIAYQHEAAAARLTEVNAGASGVANLAGTCSRHPAARSNAMTTSHRRLVHESTPPPVANTLIERARALKLAAESGSIEPRLKGKNLGLLCESLDDTDAALFRSAASELGAHVAHIRPSLTTASASQVVTDTAEVLGLLYDAVECQGMAPTLVRGIGEAAGVPVYDGIAAPSHPTAHLAEQLDGGSSRSENRRYVLQAVLLDAIG
jgi:ornithine carbamoyltransferase